jgi:hypothetical protein
MSKTYTIILSDAEDKALSTVCLDQNTWIQEAIHNRCAIAINEVAQQEIERLLSEGKPIAGSKEDIVLAAVVETGAQRNARLEAEYQEFLKSQQG